MADWTRRDVFRMSAGAAAATAIPLAVVGATASGSSASTPAPEARLTPAELERSVTGRVMVCVHDATRGEVSILQGDRERIFQDHQLVAKLMRAAQA